MANISRDTHRQSYVRPDGTEVEHEEVSRSSSDDINYRIRSLINTIFGVIATILFIRFILSLFGANRGNGFADFYIHDL
jgi:hypothetical protein